MILSKNYAGFIWGAAFSIGYTTGIYTNGNATVTFNNNTAAHGGAMHMTGSFIVFNGNSKVTLSNNKARIEGGAIGLHTIWPCHI